VISKAQKFFLSVCYVSPPILNRVRSGLWRGRDEGSKGRADARQSIDVQTMMEIGGRFRNCKAIYFSHYIKCVANIKGQKFKAEKTSHKSPRFQFRHPIVSSSIRKTLPRSCKGLEQRQTFCIFPILHLAYKFQGSRARIIRKKWVSQTSVILHCRSCASSLPRDARRTMQSKIFLCPGNPSFMYHRFEASFESRGSLLFSNMLSRTVD
jgi:hypothetical protein